MVDSKSNLKISSQATIEEAKNEAPIWVHNGRCR